MWARVSYIDENKDDLDLVDGFRIDRYPFFSWPAQMMGLTP